MQNTMKTSSIVEDIILVRNVTKVYPNGVEANKNVSISVRCREIACLVGPNGAGKTTLIRQIMGLLKPSRGKIYVLGVDPLEKPDVIRENVGYVPQMPLAFPAHRVVEVLDYVAKLANKEDTKIEELLKLLGLENARYLLGYQLSLGQRKLLLMAMALIKDPKILILDEPTSFVDIVNRQLIWELVSRVKNDGKTILLVSHDIDEIKRLCSKIYVMVAGRIVYGGSIEALRRLSGIELKVYTDNPQRLINMIKHGAPEVRGNTIVVYYDVFSNALKDLEALSKTNIGDLKLVLEYPSLTYSIAFMLDHIVHGENH